MARILGLDLGAWSVKGILMESTGRGTQVLAGVEIRRGEGEHATPLPAAVRQLLAELPVSPEQVLVSLPGPSLAMHALQLPFVDAKRLEQTVPFEVESQLPFDLGEAVFDYQVVGQHDGKSDLLVSVVRRTELVALLEMLN